jgi:hypothetical protein
MFQTVGVAIRNAVFAQHLEAHEQLFARISVRSSDLKFALVGRWWGRVANHFLFPEGDVGSFVPNG